MRQTTEFIIDHGQLLKFDCGAAKPTVMTMFVNMNGKILTASRKKLFSDFTSIQKPLHCFAAVYNIY